MKALNRALFEAGIFVIRDNPQGKRYGRRDDEGPHYRGLWLRSFAAGAAL